MDPSEEMRTVAIQQNLVGDFPAWLLPVADDPEKYEEAIPLVETSPPPSYGGALPGGVTDQL